jgi:hypothetical protein
MFPSADNRSTSRDSLADSWQRAWPSIVRIIILEILLLLALSGALVLYLNWSSQAAVSEFMTGESARQAVKAHLYCDRSA